MKEVVEALGVQLGLTDVEYQVLRYIRLNPGRSRTEIAASLNLSKSMLTKAVSKFVQIELVIEQQVTLEHGERGKPPVLLSLRGDRFHSIGVYVNRQICAVVRADLSGNVLYKFQKTLTSELAIEDIVREVENAIRSSRVPVIGIGYAVPAIIADDGELFEVTPTQATLPISGIVSAIRSRFQMPVFWENDAFCSATYEANSAFSDRRCVFYTALGFGVGGGVTFNGSVFRGAYNQAANIGGLIPETGPRPSLTDLAKYLNYELRDLSYERLSELFAAKDRKLSTWIEDRGARMSQPLSASVQFFNPDAILIGGFFPRAILEAICANISLDVYDVTGRRPLTRPIVQVSRSLGPQGTAEAASFLPIAALILGQKALSAAHE
ncbi:ROK family transcriptional regulator [Rhizobium sp. NFACC06-2]|uniref:ROK family transcriptional regulator n=1 Tax=Rhizobium sp. NFACC06-2 TaxID=1566264 RepID=UPI0008771B0D|nr:ROK family transcriptional regulator [Rhizobium sp. NFACC06-2]SCY90992.1 Sugar kinase of the NBD/HSP70 family, may contain an N-terminal HTH domain [Rhizobium sp. NFACC06-2]